MFPTIVFRAVTVLCLMAGAGACASTGERTFVAATDRTVVSRLEPASGGRGQHVVVQNSSTVEIVVNGVALADCEHVRTRCEVHRLRVPVGPGQRRQVFTIVTDGSDQGHNFRYSISWEASAAPPDIPGQ